MHVGGGFYYLYFGWFVLWYISMRHIAFTYNRCHSLFYLECYLDSDTDSRSPGIFQCRQLALRTARY